MSVTCKRCYKVVDRACQSDVEWIDCPHLARPSKSLRHHDHVAAADRPTRATTEALKEAFAYFSRMSDATITCTKNYERASKCRKELQARA